MSSGPWPRVDPDELDLAEAMNTASRAFGIAMCGMDWDRNLALLHAADEHRLNLARVSPPPGKTVDDFVTSVQDLRLALSAAHEAWNAAARDALRDYENAIIDAVNEYKTAKDFLTRKGLGEKENR